MTNSVPDGFDAFVPALGMERETIAQFVELLRLEQESLRHGVTDGLLEIVGKKDALAVTLGHLAKQRCAALEAQGYSTNRQGVEAWCAKHPETPEAGDIWAAILTLAGEARELQRVSGELIQIHMHYNAKALEALRGDRATPDLYGPDGQSTKPSDQHINHSV